MALIVQKFGGSSVADISRLQNVARIVKRTQNEGYEVVVVVSAMYGETDRLIKLADSFSASNQREYDALVATGEQMSAALLSLALESVGCKACSLTGSQIKISTTSVHKKARIIDIDTDVILHEISTGRVPVITGFQGVSKEGAITTLGRGGSDLTAVAIASVLKADECQIYTDVDGVYTSDPNIVPEARRINKITFDEMMELASMGAKVLQNRCLQFAGKFEVPIRVLSSLKNDSQGTLISYEKEGAETPVVRGVAFDRKQAQISLLGVPKRPGLVSYLLSPIGEANIEVDMIVQSPANQAGLIDLSFTLRGEDFDEAQTIAKSIGKELSAVEIRSRNDVAKLSVVGVGLRSHASVTAAMLSALGREGIEVGLLSASEIKVSVILEERLLDLGARALHEAFALGGALNLPESRPSTP